MSLELELKYIIVPEAANRLENALSGCGQLSAVQRQTLLNAYFDTPELWFRQHDMGLRTRQRKDSFEQTIKLAGKQHGAMQIRPEYNVPCAGVLPELSLFPAEIWPEKADVPQLQASLVELFRTDFVRLSWQITTAEAVIEVVYDQGWIVAAKQKSAISELELELVSGKPEALFSLAETLLAILPIQAGWLSKAARGYQLFWQRGTTKPKPVAPSLQGKAAINALLQGIQQLESCYQQQSDPVLLNAAAEWFANLAASLSACAEPVLAKQAALFAEALRQQHVIFTAPDYQRFLLALSRLLFTF